MERFGRAKYRLSPRPPWGPESRCDASIQVDARLGPPASGRSRQHGCWIVSVLLLANKPRETKKGHLVEVPFFHVDRFVVAPHRCSTDPRNGFPYSRGRTAPVRPL